MWLIHWRRVHIPISLSQVARRKESVVLLEAFSKERGYFTICQIGVIAIIIHRDDGPSNPPNSMGFLPQRKVSEAGGTSRYVSTRIIVMITIEILIFIPQVLTSLE